MSPFEWTLLVMVILSVTLSVTVALLTPKPDLEDAKPSGLGEYNFPTNLESRYIPVVWGTTELKGPNVIWYGDFSTVPFYEAGQRIGHRYFLGMDLAMCYGPLDNISAMQLDDKYALKPGEKASLRTGLTPAEGWRRPPGGERQLVFRDYSLFGGDDHGGRLDGTMAFYYGTSNQRPNEYLQTQEASNTYEVSPGVEVSQRELIPAYPGLAHAVWQGGNISERAVIPKISFTVHRYPRQLSPKYSVVNMDPLTAIGDANPIHCIYEILTDTVWGCSVPPQTIDIGSFLDAAQECYSEGNGFGYTLDTTKAASTIIEMINQQVNGLLFQDENGLWAYRLVRKDYLKESKFRLDYNGVVFSTSEQLLLNDTMTGSTGGPGDYQLTAMAGTPSLTGYPIGEPLRIFKGSDETGISHSFLLNSVDDGLNEIYLDALEDQDYTDFVDASEIYSVYRLDGYETLVSLDPSSLVQIKTADRQSWNETFNVVQVKYLDRADYFKEAVATSHDMGNLAIQRGVQTIKKFDMPGIRSSEAAARVAQRLLRSLSYPITSLAIEVPREHYKLRPGDVVHIEHPDFGLDDFFMRIMDVSLPNDRGASIVLKGMRDTFDEPTGADIVATGGHINIAPNISATVDPPIEELTLVDGMPLFYHTKLSVLPQYDPSLYYAWHVIGQPSASTTLALDTELSSGEYIDATSLRAAPATGHLIPYVDHVWKEQGESLPELFTYPPGESGAGSRHASSVYGGHPGSYSNPQRASHEGADMVDYRAWGTSPTLARHQSPIGINSNISAAEPRLGEFDFSLMVMSPTLPDGSFTNIHSQAAIQGQGIGLAIVRPGWAKNHPDVLADPTQLTKFDEIIGYEEATAWTLYHNDFGIGGGSRISTHPLSGATISSNPTGVGLKGVHRGLLDTGIQNHGIDTDIIFLPTADSVVPDLEGQVGPAVVDRTYYPQTHGLGGQLDMSLSFGIDVVAEDIVRRTKTLGVKDIRLGYGGPFLDIEQTWGWLGTTGYGRFDQMGFMDWAGSAGEEIVWGYKDPTTSPGEVNLYTDNDNVGQFCKFTVNLLEDDTTTGSTQAQRDAHARAFWKEGYMPTVPPMSHPAVTPYEFTLAEGTISPGVAETTFAHTNSFIVSGTSHSFVMESQFPNADLTQWEYYYAEVQMQSCSDAQGSDLSHGCQRFIVSFTAFTA